jgi:hypothetical protein
MKGIYRVEGGRNLKFLEIFKFFGTLTVKMASF